MPSIREIWESTNWLSITGLVFIAVGSLMSAIGGIISGNKSQKELTERIQAKDTVIDNIQNSSSNILTKTESIVESNEDLVFRNAELSDKIDSYQLEIREKDRRLQALNATHGRLIPRGKIDMTKNFTIRFGTVEVSKRPADLVAGQEFNPFLMFGMELTFNVRIADDQAAISFDLRNIDDEIVGRMSDNVWFLSPGVFDRNYNQDKVEIIDNDGISKFQIDISNPQEYKINGAFIARNGFLVIINDAGMKMTSIGGYNKKQLSEFSRQVPNIFEYPSAANLGVLAKKK